MARVFIVRILGGIGSVFGASILSFVLLRALPANPTRLVLGPLAPPAAVKALTKQMGLDKSLPVQYWDYITQFFRGNWGYSYIYGRTVRDLIGQRLPASIELGFCAFLIALVAGTILALASTYREGSVIGGVSRVVALVGIGTPLFWLSLVALLIFVVWLGVLPGPSGEFSANITAPPTVTGMSVVDSLIAGDIGAFWNACEHLILPALVLALPSFGYLYRQLRANLVEVGDAPFLLAARARGLSRWTTYLRHALPNAVLPTLTASGMLLGQLLVGSVFVETIFDWPGVGQLVVNSISNQDYSVVQAFVFLSACGYVVINLAVDLIAGVLDPRIRTGGVA